jgi:hypothetical protein
MPTLNEIINAIPVAEDGHVFYRQHYNLLREAVVMLAAQQGAGVTGQTEVLAYPPHFITNGDGPNWRQENGVATKDPDNAAHGFFAVQLPQHARIQSMAVSGRRVGPVASFTVKLLRVSRSDGDSIALISTQLKDAADPFNVSQGLAVPNAGPSALEEYRQVDNNTFTYLVVARAIAATDLVQINSVMISYVRA